MATYFNLYDVDRLVEKRRLAQYGNRELDDPNEQASALREQAEDEARQRTYNQNQPEPEQVRAIPLREERASSTFYPNQRLN